MKDIDLNLISDILLGLESRSSSIADTTDVCLLTKVFCKVGLILPLTVAEDFPTDRVIQSYLY